MHGFSLNNHIWCALSNYKINVSIIHKEIIMMIVVNEQFFLIVKNIRFRRVMAISCLEFKMARRNKAKKKLCCYIIRRIKFKRYFGLISWYNMTNI